MELTLPELPPCPHHPDGQNYAGFASCRLCWNRFYFRFEFEKVIKRINTVAAEYIYDVERAKTALVP